MQKLLKLLPADARHYARSGVAKFRNLVATLFGSNRKLADFYYFLLNSSFSREHRAVLAGQAAYERNLKNIQESCPLLRRNVHRLEKGLIMRPRRAVFAENFILETVEIYRRAISFAVLDENEEKWCRDVLREYFQAVSMTATTAKAKGIFEACLSQPQEESGSLYVPYQYQVLPKELLSYDSLYTLFLKRRSVRWYQDQEVPLDLIYKAVNAATLAPSACNRQPYTFHISTSKTKVVEIAECAGGTKGFAGNIPCIAVIIGDLSAYPYERDRHLIYIDTSLAAMQLMLALETLGLSSCPLNWPDIGAAERKLQKILQLKHYERPVMLLAIGYACESGGIPYSQKKSSELLVRIHE